MKYALIALFLSCGCPEKLRQYQGQAMCPCEKEGANNPEGAVCEPVESCGQGNDCRTFCAWVNP